MNRYYVVIILFIGQWCQASQPHLPTGDELISRKRQWSQQAAIQQKYVKEVCQIVRLQAERHDAESCDKDSLDRLITCFHQGFVLKDARKD